MIKPRLSQSLFTVACLAAAAFQATAGAPPERPKAAPVELEGTWTWTWKDRNGATHRHVLKVEGKGTKLAAREIFDDEQPVRVNPLKLEGRSVRFTVVRGNRKSEYAGEATDADHLKGTVLVTTDDQTNEFEWKAEREKMTSR